MLLRNLKTAKTETRNFEQKNKCFSRNFKSFFNKFSRRHAAFEFIQVLKNISLNSPVEKTGFKEEAGYPIKCQKLRQATTDQKLVYVNVNAKN